MRRFHAAFVVTLAVSSAFAAGVACGRATREPAPITGVAIGSAVAEPTPRPNDADASDASSSEGAQRELAWAQRTFPTELGQLRAGVPSFEELRRWLPREPYLKGHDRDCVPMTLIAAEQPMEVTLKLVTRERVVGGVEERDYDDVVLRNGWLRVGGSGGTDQRRPGNEWEGVRGYAALSPDYWVGLLTSIEPDVARFDGEPVWLGARCDGPPEPMACADGGTQQCDSCKKLAITLSSRFGHQTRTPRMRLVQTCAEPCPEPTSAELARLLAFAKHPDLWQPVAQRWAFYRELSRCKAAR